MVHIQFRSETTCAFCDNPPGSKEHAWPNWILKHLKTTPISILGDIEGQPALLDPYQKALKIPCVCEPCNTRRMKALEDATIPIMKPLIDDSEAKLDVLQQWTLARWATKTAMVFEYVTTERSTFYTTEDRRNLWNHSTPTIPSRTYVWLGRYLGRFPLLTYGADAGGFNKSLPNVTAYTTTLAFGALAIQVITIRPNSEYRTITTVHPKQGPWPDSTVRIWPTQNVVRWPPRLAFTDDTPFSITDDLHARFHNPRADLGGFLGDDVMRIDP
jgi:hypothetical protein